jgi:glucose/arabinose dehydrogenase
MARSIGLALLLSALTASTACAATLTSIGTFQQPIFVTSDPGDSSRLLVVEREGRVAEAHGEEAPRLYADLTPFVTCCESERGLLSIAPAPDFHESGLFYAAYTGKSAAEGGEGEKGDIHVDAFTAGEDGHVTRRPILSVGHSQEANHNGGQLQFGPDGYLYLSTGDGGGSGDPFESGQSLSTLLGKILRIDPHPGQVPAYSIPPGNPFAGVTAGADEIWTYGLRNPWRFSFDSLTGGLVIADVGQGAHEEVDWSPSPAPDHSTAPGLNYGWSCREGFSAYTDATPSANCAGVANFTDPVFDYPHSDPDPPADRAYGCAITGGYVVRDPSVTDLYGRYVYADYCTSEIRSFSLPAAGGLVGDDASAGMLTPTPNPVSFGEDSCHRVYVVAGSGVYRIEGTAPATCPPPGEGEPPGGEPPGGGAPSAARPANQPPAAPVVADAAEIRLAVARGRGRLRLTVRVAPCATWRGRPVRLNRGGRRVGRKILDGDCVVVFRIPDPIRATFRALLESADGTKIRSRRFALDAVG